MAALSRRAFCCKSARLGCALACAFALRGSAASLASSAGTRVAASPDGGTPGEARESPAPPLSAEDRALVEELALVERVELLQNIELFDDNDEPTEPETTAPAPPR